MIDLLNFVKSIVPFGSILSQSEVSKWSGPIGSRFSFDGDEYVVVASGTYQNVPEDSSKVINLDNGNQALNITKQDWLGQYRAYSDLLPFTGNSFRHPMVMSTTGIVNFFPTSPNTFFPNSFPVLGDILQYRQTVAPFVTIVKYYDGTQWVDDFNLINSSTYVAGLLGATRVQSIDVLTENVRGKITVLAGNDYMEISCPTPFGPDSLVYWFGPIGGKLDANGDVIYAEIRKATSTHWMTINDSGHGYY